MSTKTKGKTKKILTPPQNIIEYFNKLDEEGKEIHLHWDGGGDSGWVTLNIDGKEFDDYGSREGSFERQLIDFCYDVLDYGSWAGEFSANGDAHYDRNQQAFIGTDYYSEDDTDQTPCNIEIAIPEAIWFDSLEISIEDEGTVTADLVVKNGFTTPEHEQQISELEDSIHEKVQDEIDKYSDEHEFRSLYEEFDIARHLFQKKGDMLVYTITSLPMGTTQTTEKDIFIDLTEIADVQD